MIPKLYDYQIKMRKRIDTAFVSYRSVMVQMPTGTGKTHLLASVVYDYVNRDEDNIVWIVAHRKELVAQIERTIQHFGIELSHKKPEEYKVRVYSIQWLSKHLGDIGETPSLIVIDEAHHALARTYREVMNAFPDAKNLGMTATPCRLNGKGFTDLFDTLLYADPIADFIRNGYLAPYDYISIPSDSEEIGKIDGLVKRAADGDYNVAEMSAVLDCRPSIEKLYNTIDEFARDKKGIVYAIDIEHANHIAEYYCERGLKAVAISSKTNDRLRTLYVNEFIDGKIQILVNVDIFSEGFDCPDAEFIQMARPTLSLAKYMQQIGRGLRVADGKECCLLLDNVGLYRLFGFPAQQWNWMAMFHGRVSGKGEVDANRVAYMNLLALYNDYKVRGESDTKMVVLCRHDENVMVCEKLFEILPKLNESFVNMKIMRRGWMLRKFYISNDGNFSVYRLVNERRMGYRLVQDAAGVYFTLNEKTERLVRIGKRNPWKLAVDEYIDRNNNVTANMPADTTRVHYEYIWQARFMECNGVMSYKGLYYLANRNAKMMVTPSYVELSKAMNGVRVFQSQEKKWGLMTQDGDYYLMWGLAYAKLYPNNIAYVKEDAYNVKRGCWVNLFTMQEFTEEPKLEKFGPVWLLHVGDVYYLQQVRSMTGVAMQREDFEYNSDMFRFFDNYIILKDNNIKILQTDKNN